LHGPESIDLHYLHETLDKKFMNIICRNPRGLRKVVSVKETGLLGSVLFREPTALRSRHEADRIPLVSVDPVKGSGLL
jgi:hypothetical protein